jgi:hypothetical protein
VSRSTISTFKLFELFPDEPSARKYLEGRLSIDLRGTNPMKILDQIADVVLAYRPKPKTKAAKRRIRRKKRRKSHDNESSYSS